VLYFRPRSAGAIATPGCSGQVALLLAYEAIIGYSDDRIHAEQSPDALAPGASRVGPADVCLLIRRRPVKCLGG